MRQTAMLFPVAGVLAAAVGVATLAAQQPAPGNSATTTASSTAAAIPVKSTANAPEVSNAELRPVTGELVSKLDTKNAKPGDSVVIKTTKEATIADGVVIPKGSKIVGHVTDVQPHEKGNDNAKLTLQFDQAELKDGKTLAIKSVIQSVGSPADAQPASQTDFGTGVPAPTGGAASPSQSASTGTMAPGSTANSAPAMSNQAQPGGAAAEAGANQGAAPQPPGTVISRQGNIAIRTTDLPGILLASDANGQPFANASGALLGARQNVKLDGGTRIVLAVEDGSSKNVR